VASAGDWWERKKGEWVREDEGVQRMAERLGFGYGGRKTTRKTKKGS